MPPRPLRTVLISVTGADGPGITAEFAQILAGAECPILDIGQAVIHKILSLFILFRLPEGAEHPAVLKDLLFKAAELGLKLEFRLLGEDANPAPPKKFRYVVTLLGDPVTAQALFEATSTLARHGLNIDTISRLSEDRASCLELLTSTDEAVDRHRLKSALLGISRRTSVDIALQAESIFRRTKRLVALDMDSTLIAGEVIDELAREKGAFEQVSAITRDAMAGKLDFDESLRRRCGLLKGLTLADLDRVAARVELTPGAADLIRVIKRAGYRVALLSGGFTFVADRLREKLGIDFAYANQLEMEGGALTGRVIPPIVNAQRKADLLDVIAQQERIHLDQVIAVGDGANDLPMLERAGLGIAFNAKPLVREKAQTAINRRKLSEILFLLGITSRELAEIGIPFKD